MLSEERRESRSGLSGVSFSLNEGGKKGNPKRFMGRFLIMTLGGGEKGIRIREREQKSKG